MENPTSFELSRAIQRWRENLTQSPAIRRENLAELEAHLRDSVAELETRGLSEEEAFVVARRRIGRSDILEREFAKVNRHAVWLDRFLWMAIGFQFWGIILNAYRTTQMIVRAVLGWTVEGTTPGPAFFLKMSFLPPALLALLLFLGWKLLRGTDGKIRAVFAGLLQNL